MKILNLGCGGTRPAGDQWVNLDDLHSQLPEGGHERKALSTEGNYCQHVIEPDGELPFAPNRFDGVLASHFFEHFDCQEAVKIMRQCRAVMKAGAVIIVSVPNASYFRAVYNRDTNKNWPELFGVNDPPNPIPTFFEAALWFDQHKGILTADALWCYLVRAGFKPADIHEGTGSLNREATDLIVPHLNRQSFSLIMSAIKS